MNALELINYATVQTALESGEPQYMLLNLHDRTAAYKREVMMFPNGEIFVQPGLLFSGKALQCLMLCALADSVALMMTGARGCFIPLRWFAQEKPQLAAACKHVQKTTWDCLGWKPE